MRTTVCLLMLFLATTVQAGNSDRGAIAARMYEFMSIDLETSSNLKFPSDS